jgi:uncharacterized membrane protein
LVVLFTNRSAFHSPIAVLVVASIGFAALLLQLRLSRATVQPHAWLNSVGILLAVCAVLLDFFRVGTQWVQTLALGAIGVFGISAAIILHALRKNRVKVREEETI